jgi:hypothetical protein
MKFYKIPSSGSRVVPCGQTDGRTDMTKIIVAFHNFAKVFPTFRKHIKKINLD